MNDIDFRIYLVTDRKQTRGKSLVDAVRQVLEGGVRAVQLREKDLTDRKVYELGCELRALTREFGARLFINDRADLAAAVEADGVHLTQSSYSAQEARRIVGRRGIIGVSTHSMDEAVKAEQEGADFVTFGPVFETPSKKAYGLPVGITLLEQVVQAVRIPVFAIGGIKRGNSSSVLETGCYGIALISGILTAIDVKQEAREFIALIQGKDQLISKV